MTSKEIRQAFKDFFASKEHRIVPSAPMVIKGDPTLMFTNAGMNQFKDVILGNVPIRYPRVADSQKCLRVSGKHNDLEEVGHDTYHHTMFEMLGNWSFGDYFKKEAIDWAWEFLTEVIKLNKDILYVTVFEGSPTEGLTRDDEAAGYWEKYLPAERILNGNKKDNFWEMGDTGPCGPCSEIHLDLRSEDEKKLVSGADLVNKDHPQVIEVWNLVFMQYNRKADSSLEPLPAKVIDTGMGFERLCMAVQGYKSNYDTDVFSPLIEKIATLSDSKYGEDEKRDIAMRVIADHVRTIAFSITDGQLPSNAKAGYVIRRILRRAVRYGYTFLDMHHSFMHKLLPTLIEVMGDAYPELIAQKTLIEKVIKEEEESFLRTLETGIKMLEKQVIDCKSKAESILNGEVAFQLYDTFGFPLDLTELILREQNMSVDIDAFNVEMEKQKTRARNAAGVEAGDWIELISEDSQFVGYDLNEVTTEIVKYRKVKQKNKEFYQLVLSKTPFYAEMGGQVGDSGYLIDEESGEKIDIFDTKNENNLAVHLSNKLPTNLEASFRASINFKKRIATECNHTATHLVHEALREVLGSHVEQRGSFVSADIFRFDFAHFQKVTDEEIKIVEKRVLEKIRLCLPLEENRSVPVEEAKAKGAMALFGEKYSDEVRTVQFGSSIELCGGTHIANTGMIGSFRITSEGAIAAGVRRIEAVTAAGCDTYLYAKEEMLKSIRSSLNNTPDIMGALKKLIEENEILKKEVEGYAKQKGLELKKEVVSSMQQINGVSVFSLKGEVPSAIAKDIAFQIKGECPEHSIFVGAIIDGGKPQLLLMISDSLVKEKGFNAGQIVRESAKIIQGGGGGQPHFATAGGKIIDKLDDAFIHMLKLMDLG